MGSMNIKNEEAHRLAREIAELTGESLTGAVLAALRERRARLTAAAPEADAKLRRWLAHGQRLRRRITGPAPRSTDDAGLWDEHGLPE